VESSTTTVLPVSGTKIRRFCKFACLRTLPHGLNCVARMRFESRFAIFELLPVTGHAFAIEVIMVAWVSIYSNMGVETLFIVTILIISIVIHEVAHGYAANMLGDPTARLQGRLTLNPISHIDLMGSIIIPGLLVFTGAGILFGWAKPVPYNPYNLSNQKWGEAIVAGAGPAVNLIIAIFFGLLIRVGAGMGVLPDAFISLAGFIVYINVLLAFFNLVPVPPLDGSKILKAILPFSLAYKYEQFENMMLQYGFIAVIGFLLLFMYFLWPFFFSLIQAVFVLITGMAL
jgi:Zn-dependent protease